MNSGTANFVARFNYLHELLVFSVMYIYIAASAVLSGLVVISSSRGHISRAHLVVISWSSRGRLVVISCSSRGHPVVLLLKNMSSHMFQSFLLTLWCNTDCISKRVSLTCSTYGNNLPFYVLRFYLDIF